MFIMLTFVAHVVQAKHILVYGDSLSAAYGMELEQGWVNLLAQDLGDSHQVTNASISGETSSGGLVRLPRSLKEFQPDILLLELGANDGLRGLPILAIQKNLRRMIELANSKNIKTVLIQISLPATYGPRYIDQFREMYETLAIEFDLPLLDFYRPDFLKQEDFIQDDGLHPTAKTQPLVRDMVKTMLVDQNLL